VAGRQYDHGWRGCARTYATLLDYHRRLRPERMTAALGLRPHWTARRGEQAVLGRVVPRNVWARGTRGRFRSRDVRLHIDKVLDELRGKERRIGRLRKQGCAFAISCFWESVSGNGGPAFDPAMMRRLARYAIELQLDLWLDLPARGGRAKSGRARVNAERKGKESG
jgi:hypothetical protein